MFPKVLPHEFLILANLLNYVGLKMKQLLLSFAFIDWVAIVAIQRFYKSVHDVYVVKKLFIVFFMEN